MRRMKMAVPVVLAAATLLAGCRTSEPAAEQAPPPPVVQDQKLSADGLFPFGKGDMADISADGRAELDSFAAILLAGAPFDIVHIIGHSDRIGSAKANLALSTRRARSVRDYLVQQGVPAERISAVGRGSVEPVVECADMARDALIECLAPNRRVEIRVVPAR
ncbi:OmpA family protein [Luteimonas lutimaris]|uniref:OmpA-like domain-containing protein n=1 Tax=Luteimonas lutimaris TaxID=698645 RepID=A0ABP7MEN7_9GAMM